ncbi:phage holin family protein [Pseudomonas sp. NPDC086251]
MSLGCQALSSVLGLYQVQSPFVLIILSSLCILVFRSRGNVAQILRMN